MQSTEPGNLAPEGPVRPATAADGNLDLVPFASGDFDAVHAFAADPEVCRYATWGPNTPQDTRDFLAQAMDPAPGQLALAIRVEGAVIGSAALWTTGQEAHCGQIGYTLARRHWGSGCGTRTAKLLLSLGFGTHGLARISATCDPLNTASARVLEKAGLSFIRTLPQHAIMRGKPRDSMLFRIERTAWIGRG